MHNCDPSARAAPWHIEPDRQIGKPPTKVFWTDCQIPLKSPAHPLNIAKPREVGHHCRGMQRIAQQCTGPVQLHVLDKFSRRPAGFPGKKSDKITGTHGDLLCQRIDAKTLCRVVGDPGDQRDPLFMPF